MRMVNENGRLSASFLAVSLLALVLFMLSPTDARAETLVIYNSPSSGPLNVLEGIAVATARNGTVESSESYVAKGDCATDDSIAINAMIYALERSASHSGEVYFPKPPGGCYLVNHSLILDGTDDEGYDYKITLKGDGAKVSVVKAGAALDAVLLKNDNFNSGDTIENITFDANALAQHAIHIENADEIRISHIEGLNGTVDDLRLDCVGGSTEYPCTDGESFVSDSTFANFTTFPDYNIVISGENQNLNADYGSTDNELINNIVQNARIANIYEGISGTNHLVGNHAVSWPLSMCPKYGFVTQATSVWLNNQTDCSTEAGFFVKGGGLIQNNIIEGAQNHGLCLSSAGINGGGGAILTGNAMSFVNAAGTATNPPAGNAIVQSSTNGSCADSVAQTAIWGNDANYWVGNVIQNNTPTSNENIWNMLYISNPDATVGSPVPSRIGIGISEPQATLDVNGYARLTENVTRPAVCSALNKGSITLNGTGRLCVCNGSGWVMNSSSVDQKCWD